MPVSCELTLLKGVGPKSAASFEKAGIPDLSALIAFYPVNYQTLEEPGKVSEATEGASAAFCGFLEAPLSVRHVKNMAITAGTLRCGAERIGVVWYNMPYLRSTILPGREYVMRGMVKFRGKNPVLNQPAVYAPEEYEEKRKTLQPVYPLTAGLTENMFRKALRQIFDALDHPEDALHDTAAALTAEYLPDDIRKRYELSSFSYALRAIHFPEDDHSMRMARRRLVFDEFLLFILNLRTLRDHTMEARHSYRVLQGGLPQTLLGSLPYQLTGAQKRVWETVSAEMASEKVMTRLIQGDVGSGKTIIAFLAMLQAASNEMQAALMVPTEVLARQHYESFTALAGSLVGEERIVCLTGSVKAKERREAYRKIGSGEALIIIGTHALIQEAVTYHRLVLVITDEQHRFGVRQRETFSFKGEMPHTLVMSATPIPRTLAVILYGDLDISVIDEMPKNRIPIRNCVVGKNYRDSAYRFIARQAAEGHQAYVICPLVEESPVMDGEDVVSYTQLLREKLPGLSVEMLHGKMKPQEKNRIMEAFAAGQIQVLCSTTVVEVGVNVPNATVMMIENAERFGLAQLHQLRGRVGRGADQSYCIMIDASGREQPGRRLQVLNRSNDGFEIASEDLKLRGPGDLFGIRQSGILGFVIADVFKDADILQSASQAAEDILRKDPTLSDPENRKLCEKMNASRREGGDGLNI